MVEGTSKAAGAVWASASARLPGLPCLAQFSCAGKWYILSPSHIQRNSLTRLPCCLLLLVCGHGSALG